MPDDVVVGRLPRPPERPEPVALVHADGQVARDQTQDGIRILIAIAKNDIKVGSGFVIAKAVTWPSGSDGRCPQGPG